VQVHRSDHAGSGQFTTRKARGRHGGAPMVRSDLGSHQLEPLYGWARPRYQTVSSIPLSTGYAPSSPGGVIDSHAIFSGGRGESTTDRPSNSALTTTPAFDFERMVEDRSASTTTPAGRPGRCDGANAQRPRGLRVLDLAATNQLGGIDRSHLKSEARPGAAWRVLAGVALLAYAFKRADHYLANGKDSAGVSTPG